MAEAADFSMLSSGNAPARTVKAGDVIFRAGDAAGEMYVIKTGTVEIRVGNRVLEKLGENMIFGEMALIDSSRRSADVVAVTDATIIPVAENQFLWMVSQTPFFALKVMRVLAQRLRTAQMASLLRCGPHRLRGDDLRLANGARGLRRLRSG
jgi:CRP/FNR family transcriptional regulator, cyclic AMP receptor protein